MQARLAMIDLEEGEAWRVPSGPGVYVLWRGENPAYVGKTTNLQRRFGQHARRSHNVGVQRAVVEDGLRFTYERLFTDVEITARERELIRDLSPPMNIHS